MPLARSDILPSKDIWPHTIGQPMQKEKSMRSIARGWPMLLLSAIWLSAVGLATAGEPLELVRQTSDQVLKILEDPQLQGSEKQAERQERLRKIADQAFDWQEMARRALAVHWRERTPQERQEFVQLFRDLVERAYMQRLETAIQEKQDIQYLGEQVDGSRAVVKTQVLTKRNQQVPIEYRLHKVDGRWKIYDVLVEGISLVNNYRSQFNRIISSSSYSALVDKMRSRQSDELSSGPERRVQ
jgi:phospholipid transport system substrate-binding protein